MMKKSVSAFAVIIIGLLLLCGCGEMALSTTNERLDSTERQLSYQTNSMRRYSVEEAYENDLLTKTDIAYAMYYAQGRVYTCKKSDWEKNNTEAIKEIDFTPIEECPAISEQVELDIKHNFYDDTGMNFNDIAFEEFAENVSFKFVGSYNGTFVITEIESIYWDYGTSVPPSVYIGGFVWSGSNENNLFVFRYE